VEVGAEEVFLGASERYPTEYQMQQFALYWGMVEADESHHIAIRTISHTSDVRLEI